MPEQMDDRQWHLDKRVPLALIITMMAQFATGIWWISSLGVRVDVLERSQSSASGIRDDIVTMKEQLRNLDRVVLRLERYLDRANRTGNPSLYQDEKG